jgi:hypothetical protein
LLSTLTLLPACASEEAPAETQSVSTRETDIQRMQSAAQGMCDTSALALTGDFQGAIDTYFRSTHGYVHELAEKLSGADPVAAGELLQADQQFEAVLAEKRPDPEALEQASIALATSFARGVVTTGLPRPDCAEPSDA